MEEYNCQITFLIVDDDVSYVDAIYRLARNHDIMLTHAASLEDARDIFSRNGHKSISGIILDVVGLRERNQKVPDNSFIMAASKYFAEHAAHLPIVVLTGEPDQYRNLKELFKGTMGVYSKGRDEEEMLTFLRDEARKLDRVKFNIEYPEVFHAIRKYLDEDAENELIDCLKDMDSQDLTVIRKNLGNLRRLQEKMYIALNKLDRVYVPDEYIVGEIRIPSIYKHLSEKGCVERYKIIDRFAEVIFKITSDHGAHVPYLVPKYQPTGYTVKSLVYAMMDMLLWFGSLVADVQAAES
jgi:DNA-binding NarL/FixJ family response regulator